MKNYRVANVSKISWRIRRAWSAALMLALIGLALVPVPAHGQGTIRYVDGDATGAANGTSWADAYTTVQDALAAAGSGDEIWVAEGVYYPDEGAGQTDNARGSTFSLEAGVALYGGFAGTETLRGERDWDLHVTVLSGDIDQNDTVDATGVVTDTANIVGSNAYTVVKAYQVPDTAILDGFTITAGKANEGSCPGGGWCGGGMVNYGDGGTSSTPTLSHLVFSGNTTTHSGGGLYSRGASLALTDVTFVGNSTTNGSGGGMALYYESTPSLDGLTFERNSATQHGGGLYLEGASPVITNTTFISNTAGRGGGLYATVGWDDDTSSPTLTDVFFTGNHASITQSSGGDGSYCNGGGGMCQVYGGTATLTRVTFEDNTAALGGAGLYVDNAGGSAVLSDVTFTGNVSDRDGGGLYNANNDLTLAGGTFTDNSAGGVIGGGGAYHDSGVCSFTDVTFSGNSGSSGGGLYLRADEVHLSSITFERNGATSSGGGLRAVAQAVVVMTDTVFIENEASYGGGFSNAAASAPVRMDHVTFTRNTATDQGGGMNNQEHAVMTNVAFYGNRAAKGAGLRNYLANGHTSIANALFVGNVASEYGGGIYSQIEDTDVLTITNAAFVDNSAPAGGGLFNEWVWSPGSVWLTNDIFWGNTGSHVVDMCVACGDSPAVQVTYSDVQGGWTGAGTENIDADPLFVASPSPGVDTTWGTGDDDYGDLRLGGNSPAIDAGDDGAVTVLTDLDGNDRILGAAVDMGAYEFTGTIVALNKSVVPTERVGCHGTVTYTLNLSNVSALDDAGVALTDTLPAGVTFGQWVSQPTGAAVNSGEITWSGPISATEGITISFTATHLGDYGDTITNTAYFSGTEQSGSSSATFRVEDLYTLGVTLAGDGIGSVTSDPVGIDCGEDCTEELLEGTVITLTATAGANSYFAGWGGDCSGTDAACVVTMDGDRGATATFDLVSHDLEVTTTGEGSGSVALDPPGGVYKHGTVVTATAQAGTGSYFAGWGGDCSGTDLTCQVTVDAGKAITGTFELLTYTLGISTAGEGSGSVALDPPGGVYKYGSVVTLTATASANSYFAGWSGDAVGSDETITVTIDTDPAMTATFELLSYSLEVSMAGEGSGSVTLDPPGGVYKYGTVVDLTAVAGHGSTFAGWSGDASGVNQTTSVTMTGPRTVTASFDLLTHTLDVAMAGDGSGTVTLDPPGGVYYLDTVVTLTAAPDPDSTFVGWSGDINSPNESTIIAITEDKAVTATFARIIPSEQPPVADAGLPQTVALGATVTLDGSASWDPEGEPLAYHWEQTGGRAVQFDPDLGVSTFTAPVWLGELTFTLTVTDTGGLSDTAGTTVTVEGDLSQGWLPLVLQ